MYIAGCIECWGGGLGDKGVGWAGRETERGREKGRERGKKRVGGKGGGGDKRASL